MHYGKRKKEKQKRQKKKKKKVAKPFRHEWMARPAAPSPSKGRTGLIVAGATQAVDSAWREIYGHE
jgi:hypothetical protein